MPLLPLVQRIIVLLSTVGISDATPFLFLFLGLLIPFYFPPSFWSLKMLQHMCAHTHTKYCSHQLSAGVMIVVPSACLTKTLTQQLVVYSFALDNRMCSSIRPQITQSVKIRSSLSHGEAMCADLWQLIGRRDRGVRGTWAEKKDRRGGDVEREEQEIEGDRESVPDKEVVKDEGFLF